MWETEIEAALSYSKEVLQLSEISIPDDPESGKTADDATPAKHPLAHVFATVERSVNEIRTSDISSWDVRQQARARGRGQIQAWTRIRSGDKNNRPRGAR